MSFFMAAPRAREQAPGYSRGALARQGRWPPRKRRERPRYLAGCRIPTRWSRDKPARAALLPPVTPRSALPGRRPRRHDARRNPVCPACRRDAAPDDGGGRRAGIRYAGGGSARRDLDDRDRIGRAIHRQQAPAEPRTLGIVSEIRRLAFLL